MSYCRFENTLLALQECYEALETNEELSESEAKKKDELLELCQNIADTFYISGEEKRMKIATLRILTDEGKLSAVKFVKINTGKSLKESLDYVESLS